MTPDQIALALFATIIGGLFLLVTALSSPLGDKVADSRVFIPKKDRVY